ncbi:hypothetical protein F2Q70_00013266 [Brassica cretica]|uniref:Uncharacterized protein n=1 Tax=Brassica cretica TaxID=69181 RepID=A0A8S9M8W5_BRACR|nr:hypothetical protein F2Q70_00013266 [Brassica cretica]
MTDGISSFWGPVTSTIECCEKNYAYSSYIAEFHNTISNVPDILLNPQGHALWHVFMGFNSYFANTFLMFCRAQQRGWSPKVKYFLGVLPYVKIEKPKTQ